MQDKHLQDRRLLLWLDKALWSVMVAPAHVVQQRMLGISAQDKLPTQVNDTNVVLGVKVAQDQT